MRRRLSLFAVTLLAASAAAATEKVPTQALSARDVNAIRAVIEAYRTAWLRGDSPAVLDTFTPDAVLLPANGASPIVGLAAIKKYWFPPDAPSTTITGLDITVEDVQVEGRVASVYGHDDVEWSQVENGVTQKRGHPGTYLNVMIKLPDGSWRISRHMWDDGSPK